MDLRMRVGALSGGDSAGSSAGGSAGRLRFLQSVFENASDCVLVTAADSLDESGPKIVYANAAFQGMSGYSPDELVGRTPRVLQGPETERSELDRVRRALDRAEPVKAELLNYRKDGEEFWVEMELTPVFGDGETPEFWISLQRETTLRKRAEERLRETEKTLRSVLAWHETEMVILLEPDGGLRYESPAVKRTLGYCFAEIPPDGLCRRVHPEDVERLSDVVARCFTNPGESLPVEGRVMRTDGVWRWLEVVVDNRSEDPEVRGIFIRARDVTSRKEAEKALRESEERFRSLFQNSSEIVKICDPDGTLRYTSPSVKRILGHDPEEIVGKNVLDLVHPDDLPSVIEATNDALQQDGVARNVAEYRVRHADGDWRHVETNGTYLLDDPALNGVLITTRDITDRKEAEEALRESEERFRTAFEAASTGVALVSLDNYFLRANLAMCEMLGYTEDELLEKRSFDLTHPGDLEKSRDRAAKMLLEGGPEAMSLEKRYVRKDGSVVWAISDVSLVRDSAGAPSHFVSQMQDITRRKYVEESLKASEAQLASVTAGAPIILLALDREGTILLSKGKGLAPLGVKPGQNVGRSVLEVYRDYPVLTDSIRQALGGEEVHSTVTVGDLTFDSRYSPVFDDDGSVDGIIGVATDITSRLKLERELERRAFHDPLTDLANRALCLDRISHALGRIERNGSSVALLFMDIDDFKIVNDSLGHHIGDELLVEVSRRLKQCLRPGDTLARLGGDEFVMLVEGAGVEEAVRVAERVEKALALPFFLGQRAHERYASVSTGITATSCGGREAEDLLREADLAMYQAKDEGRARYGIFDSRMSARARDRVELESQLRRALKRDEFEVHYQPIVSLSSGKVASFEALTRWRHPERGLVHPSEFISLMEETGLILPLGRLVLREACRSFAGWRSATGEETPGVCVNLSARQFRHSGLPSDVARILEENGVPARKLSLEITESVAMGDSAQTETLADLGRLGVGLMIDDFGTGHSSLAYLKTLPVDFLKIDRTFTSGLGEDALDEEIVAAIVRLGHAAELRVVAEGVETKEQFTRLEGFGCDYAQGNYFARPTPGHRVPDLLKSL